MTGEHNNVMHIDQRLAGKGGEAFKTIDKAYGLDAVKRQHAEGLRPRSEFGRQVRFRKFAQRLATASRITRISVKQLHQRVCVRGVCIVNPANMQLLRSHDALSSGLDGAGNALCAGQGLRCVTRLDHHAQ